MTFLDRVSAALAALRGTPSHDSPRYDAPVWARSLGHIPFDLNLTVDQQIAVSAAWACIRAIVDPIAASEIRVYEEAGGKRNEQRDGWLFWLLNVEPHPQYTSQGWSEVMLTRAVAWGDSYAYIRPDGAGRTYSMQPLDPLRMLADDENGEIVYRYHDPLNGQVLMAEREVIHIRGPRTGGFFGDSPLARASAALALAKAQENYATDYYANGALPGVLLKAPPTQPGPLSKEQKTDARTAWKALFGARKKGGVGVLDPGWELQVVETDAEKSQMISARDAQVMEIARYFGVPGHLLGVKEASQGYGKNLAELSNGFVRQTLEPWARRVEEELRRKLMPDRRGRGWWMEYDLSRLRKGDEESQARAEEISLRTGVLTINEARAARGLASVEGGDETLVGGLPLDDILNPPEPPAPAPQPGNDMGGPDEPATADAGAPVKTRPKPNEAMMLERHGRRVRARVADLQSKGTAAAEIARHTARLRAQACAEIRAAYPEVPERQIVAALEAVEHGVEPEKAGQTLAA